MYANNAILLVIVAMDYHQQIVSLVHQTEFYSMDIVYYHAQQNIIYLIINAYLAIQHVIHVQDQLPINVSLVILV